MTRWVAGALGPDVPLHFTAFHPDFKMNDVPPTPPATLSRARDIALDNGVRHAYTGNVHDPAGGSTYCHSCGGLLIERDWYRLGAGTSTIAAAACTAAASAPAVSTAHPAPGARGGFPSASEAEESMVPGAGENKPQSRRVAETQRGPTDVTTRRGPGRPAARDRCAGHPMRTLASASDDRHSGPRSLRAQASPLTYLI